MNRPALLTGSCLALLLLSSACVSSGKYDAAVKSAEDLNAERVRDHSALNTLQGRVDELQAKLDSATAEDAKLQAKLDGATAEDAKLRAELERLGTNTDALLAEKGTLASALSESKTRLEELRRAHAAAEARARLYRDLALRLRMMVAAGDLSIVLRDGRMVLQLPNDVLFESGQVDIRPRGQSALKQVAAVLKTLDGRHFQVAGHTDNVPIETTRFPSNWELSTARGVEVVRFLIAQGVVPGVLAAAGYGEFDPVSANDNARGRAHNRRIEITLQPNVDEIVSVPEAK
jgi:chemotaxis protein MotB